MRGNVLVPVSRQGVAAMRAHYHVEQDGHLVGYRFPRRRTAWTMVIKLAKDLPASTWRVVACSGCTITHV